VIWIMLPLVAFVIFGLYVRREAERIRAEDAQAVERKKAEELAGPRVIVKLKLAGDGMATIAELHIRQAIEDEIERRGIGSIADATSGEGWAQVSVVAQDLVEASAKIRELLRARGILDTSVVETSITGP
jgi:hypothetical protein